MQSRLSEIVSIISQDWFNQFVVPTVFTLSLLGLAYLITRFSTLVLKNLQTENSVLDEHHQEIFYRFFQVVTYLFTLVLILSVWKIQLANVLIGAGFISVLIGLAARQSLDNAFSGLVIIFTQPYRVGHWIEFNDTIGVVKEISLLSTRLRTPQGNHVAVPNEVITKAEITNWSKESQTRIELTVGVDYDCEVKEVLDVTEAALEEINKLEQTPPPNVFVEELSDSAVTLRILFWTSIPTPLHRKRMRSAVATKLHREYRENDITIPFPQRTLSVREDNQLTELGSKQQPHESEQL